ncbi:MAG: type II toxin-antitoxin system RelE/ParE family toxin [Spirochaetia bacterium]|nr:type II toxin-antitoxin system RelE/ParE family toxin [Spirochaetia bacterium]
MKKIKVVWTETAVKDLDDIIEYISINSINNAIEQYDKIKNVTIELNEFPKSGRIIPELYEQNIIKYRELIVSPWRIMYKEDHNIVYVMAIIDGRRNIEDILMRRNIR